MSAWLENLRGHVRRVECISPWWRMLALLVAFTAVLGSMIWQRQEVLTHGQEVILRVRPFDPRDLLRGHYAMLQFDISRISPERFVDTPEDAGQGGMLAGKNIYVVLRKEANSPFWTLARASWKRPTGLAPGEVMLKGRVDHVYGDVVRVEYGIERYYAPKERAQALERLVRGRWRFDPAQGHMVRERDKQPPGIILKVDEGGRASIAGWFIDGRRLLEPGPF